MTIASEIARLQAAKVDIMAALVEKGVDVTGKNLVDVPGLIDGIVTQTVRIGEHDYPYVKIGNLYWLSRDLYEDTQGSYWFKNEVPEEGSLRGKIYQWNDSHLAVENLCHDGWRIPTLQDLQSVLATIGNVQSDWLTTGTNTFGWNGILSGTRWHSGTWGENDACYWSSTQNKVDTHYGLILYYDPVVINDPNSTPSSLSYQMFRLCKDA